MSANPPCSTRHVRGRPCRERHPFATKDPNVGRVNVPDPRLDVIARIVRPACRSGGRSPDIAGLVKGLARRGTGQPVSSQHPRNRRDRPRRSSVRRRRRLASCGRRRPGARSRRDGFELALSDLAIVEKRLDRSDARRHRRQGGAREVSALERAHELSEGARSGTCARRPTTGACSHRRRSRSPVLYAARLTPELGNGAEGRDIARLRRAIATARSRPRSFLLRQDRSRAGQLSEDDRKVSSSHWPRVRRTRSFDSRRLSPARPADWLHSGDPARARRSIAATPRPSRRRDPYRFRARFHSGRDREPRRLRGQRRLEVKGRAVGGQDYVVRDGDVMLFRFNV